MSGCSRTRTNGGRVNSSGASFPDDAGEVVRQAVLVPELLARVPRLVGEHETHAAVHVAGDLEPLPDEAGVERRLREDPRVGMETDRGAGAAGRLQLAQAGLRPSATEGLLPEEAVPLRRGDQLLRQRIHHAGADAVQSAGRAVGPVLELAAGVERREDDLQGVLAGLRVPVDRHAAPVVHDRHRRSIGVQRHLHVARVAVHRLVDGVVQDLPDQVVQPGRTDAPDVHAGTLPDRLEALEYRYVLGRIRTRHRLPGDPAGLQVACRSLRTPQHRWRQRAVQVGTSV